jgi:hypothetical protein
MTVRNVILVPWRCHAGIQSGADADDPCNLNPVDRVISLTEIGFGFGEWPGVQGLCILRLAGACQLCRRVVRDVGKCRADNMIPRT